MAKQQLEFEATVSAARLNKLFEDLKAGGESAARDLNAALGGTVKKTVLFETKADETGARKLVAVERERLTAVDRLSREQQKLNNIQRGSVTSLRQQVNEAKQARDQITKYSSAAGLLGGQVRSVNGEWIVANNRVAELSRQLDIASASGFWQRVKADLNIGGLASFSNGLVQITQGLQAASIVVGQFLGGVNQIINTAANLQQFGLAFKAIGVGTSGSIEALSEISRISLGLGVNIQTAQEAFQQLSPVVLNTGGTLDDVSGIVETLSSRFAAFGISGDKARRVTNGIIQAFAKGKLQAEELTQQISEADPAFKTDFARALQTAGISASGTTRELEELVKAGRITAEVLRDALPLISKSTLLFGKLGPSGASAVDALASGNVTIQQVQQNLQNLNELNLRRLATAAEPAIVSFLRLQAVVTDFLTSISKTGAAETFFNLISRITDAAVNLISGLLSLAQTVASIIDAFSPLINALGKIPGIFELAGLAIIAKFLKPLKESGGVIGGFLSAQSNLGRRLEQVWSGVAAKTFLPYIEARDAALKTAKDVSPGQIARGNDFPRLTADATKAGEAIKKSFRDPRREAIQLEKQITNLKTKIDAVRAKAVATSETPAVSATPIQTTSKEFEKALAQLKRFESGNTSFVKTQEEQQRALGSTALKITALGDGYGNLQISQAFLRDIQVLAQQDKTRAVTLLNAAIGSLRENLTKLQSGQTPLKGAIQEQAISATVANLKQAEAALEGVETGAKVMRQELQKKTVVSLGAEDARKLQNYEERLRSARRARRELNDAVKTPLSSGALSFFGRELRGNEDVLSSVRRRKVEEARANSVIIQSGRERLRQINDLIKANGSLARGAARAQTGVASPIDQQSLRTVQGLVAERNRLRDAINQETISIQRRVNAETDLNRVFGETSRFGRSVLRDTHALGLAVDLTREKWNAYKDALRQNRAEALGLKQQQAALGTQLGKLPVGSKDASRLKEEYANLGTQIQTLANQERALIPAARESASQARDAARAKRDYSKQAQNAGGAAQFFGGKIKGLANGLADGLNSIKGLGAGILEAFGPVGIVLAVVSAAQSAYSDATASARIESEKSAEIAKVLVERNKELAEAIKRARAEAQIDAGDITPDVNIKQLSGFQVLWGEIGDAIANTWNYISGESQKSSSNVSSSINQLVTDIKKVQASGIINANPFEGLARPEDAAALRNVSERIASANVQFKQFAKEATVTSQSVSSNSAQLQDNINKLRELADASKNGALSNKDFVTGFDQATQSLEQEASRLQGIRNQITQYEKLELLGALDPQSLKVLAALRSELKSSEAALDAARDKTEKLGLATGALASQAARTATSINGLQEALKGVEAALASAAFGSDEFKSAAAQAFVFQTALEKAQNAAKDPILLEAALSKESVSIANQINTLEKERNKLLGDPIRNQKALVSVEKELATLIERSKQTLEAREVIRIKLAVDELKFKSDLAKINTDIEKNSIQLRTSINQPELRQALTQIAEFRGRLRDLQTQRQQIAIRRQDPTLTEEQQIGLNREDAIIAKQIQSEITAGAANLKDSAQRLRQAAIDSRKELASARQSLLNLKLSNLNLLPPEERRKAIQELDQQVQRIERERGIQLNTRGTKDERLEQKQNFVNFYNQIQEGEDRIAKLQTSIQDVDSALNAISTSGIGEVFAGFTEPMAAIAGYLETGAVASQTIQISLADVQTVGADIASGFQSAATEIQNVANSLLSLDGQSITVNVNYSNPPGRWTGGPVDAGSQYRVNELGQEGFLSASGRISAINRPKNALWRAPSSGTVIPADVWSNLRVPNPTISANRPVSSGFSGSNGLAKIARVLQAGMARNAAPAGLGELAAVQAHQAKQIGKLGRAVDDLASKDWNVNVKVKNVGNAAYLEALNHRM